CPALDADLQDDLGPVARPLAGQRRQPSAARPRHRWGRSAADRAAARPRPEWRHRLSHDPRDRVLIGWKRLTPPVAAGSIACRSGGDYGLCERPFAAAAGMWFVAAPLAFAFWCVAEVVWPQPVPLEL